MTEHITGCAMTVMANVCGHSLAVHGGETHPRSYVLVSRQQRMIRDMAVTNVKVFLLTDLSKWNI